MHLQLLVWEHRQPIVKEGGGNKSFGDDFPGTAAGYRMLGDFYFTTGELDKATAEYGALYQEHPKDMEVKKNYIQLLIQKNRFAETLVLV